MQSDKLSGISTQRSDWWPWRWFLFLHVLPVEDFRVTGDFVVSSLIRVLNIICVTAPGTTPTSLPWSMPEYKVESSQDFVTWSVSWGNMEVVSIREWRPRTCVLKIELNANLQHTQMSRDADFLFKSNTIVKSIWSKCGWSNFYVWL